MNKPGEMFLILCLATMAFNLFSCTEAQLIPGVPGIQEIQECWKSVIETEGCVRDIFSSFIGFQIHLSPQCCKAINDMSDSCFQITFPGIPLSPLPSLIKSICLEGKAPPPRKS